MASIYQNSYVTISATNARDNRIKCLSDRPKPVKIAYENTTKKEFALRARMYSHHHPDDNGNPAKPSGPLTSRAWALQEHALSTRVLHYTATELMFECRTSYRSVASKNANAIWTAWHRIVEQYSARKLTMSGDKLPAISGIASKIRKATNSEYIAGLWKNNLAFDLLWQRAAPTSYDEEYHALETWRAPSFSWSSLNAPVTYYTPNDEEREMWISSINLVACTVNPTGLNMLGTVSDASLTLRGPANMAKLLSRYVHNAWQYTLVIKGTSAIQVTQDCCLVKARVATDADQGHWTVRRAQPKQSLSEFESAVLYLSVARNSDFISGIVLGLSERQTGAWERLGTFAAGTESLRHAEEREVLLV
ncbi:heterokaryon incompatibility protein [Stagonosporopsis vannaccii]|nr:heterokaryon incompatibility protein [Stagonosporopsis vannaccii]